jgi:hypothetical protein
MVIYPMIRDPDFMDGRMLKARLTRLLAMTVWSGSPWISLVPDVRLQLRDFLACQDLSVWLVGDLPL